MTQYNSLNVKLSNSQLNNLKPAIKIKTEVVLRLSPNMISDDETNFLHKLLLTNRQAAKLFLTNHQMISNYQKLRSLRLYNQELKQGLT